MDLHFPRQLQQQFEQAIIDGQFAQGQSVTSEQLAEQFAAPGAEMLTVLRAAHRKGIVRERATDFEILTLIPPRFDSLFQHTARAGLNPSSGMRAVTIEPMPEAIAAKLAVPMGSPAYRLERTRNVNDEPVANQVNYIPYEICPGLEEDDVSHYSFQKLLEEKYHAVFSDLKEETRIAPATNQDCEILGLPTDAQVIVVERLTFSITQCPVVWADIHIRLDRYAYVEKLWPRAAALLQQQKS